MWLQGQRRGSCVDQPHGGENVLCKRIKEPLSKRCDTLGPKHPCWRAFPLRVPRAETRGARAGSPRAASLSRPWSCSSAETGWPRAGISSSASSSGNRGPLPAAQQASMVWIELSSFVSRGC